MGINKEEKETTPPPWGWSPAQKKNAHGVKEIVYDRSFHATHHTKDRRLGSQMLAILATFIPVFAMDTAVARPADS